ncbi:MAG TPA: winged helix-turn-helix domain-containing protein [Candidatus Acidoferrum sp.]
MSTSSQYLFGEFRLDAIQRALFRKDELVSLTPKALETLLFLVERHGRIVDKKELMDAVWPNTFVEEVSLARNVSVLRRILSNGQDGHSYIETVPKRGYRFVATVAESAKSKPAPSISTSQGPLQESEAGDNKAARFPVLMGHRLLVITASTALIVAATAALAYWPRDAVPHVVRTVQLTTFGRAADPLAVTGDRLFLGTRTGGAREVAQISALYTQPTGEKPLVLPTGLAKPHIYDISPDGSELLLGSEEGADMDRSLWIMKSAGGAPKRLGNLTGTGAAWSGEGKRIAFTSGSSLYAANADGTEVRKMADVSGTSFLPRWSPDGRTIRFSVEDNKQGAASIWEFRFADSSIHRLFPELSAADDRGGMGVTNGNWTQDGKYYFFVLGRDTGNTKLASVWAVRDSLDFLGRHRAPKQIFVSPSSLGAPAVSRDGKRLFFAIREEDRELMKYDVQRRRFISWLGGTPVASVSYSRDHEWVSYVSFLDQVLWRARADGSAAVKLAELPSRPFSPVFSPNGERIAFYDARFASSRQIYVVPRDGGLPLAVTAGGDDSSPSWFPDGKAILYRHRPAPGAPGRDSPGFYHLDLETGRKEIVPGSDGKTDPVLSPDGRAVVAVSDDLHRLMLFRFGAQGWRILASGVFVRTPCWSADGQFLYFQDYYEGREQPIYRVRVKDGGIEKVATSAEFERADVFHGYVFQGLAPDGLPIVSLLRNKSDVYALELASD